MKTLDSNSIDRLTFEDIRLMKEDTRKELDTRKAALLAKGKQVFSPTSFFPGAILPEIKDGETSRRNKWHTPRTARPGVCLLLSPPTGLAL